MIPGGRPWLLWLPVVTYGAAAGALLLLAALVGSGSITWDVKSFVLTGWRLALFTAALAGLGVLALLAARGLWHRRRWSRPLALAFWVAGGLLGLVTDRSVEGPGEPLAVYLVGMMLAPAAVMALVLWGAPSMRRFFS
jgi:hypothetical protein